MQRNPSFRMIHRERGSQVWLVAISLTLLGGPAVFARPDWGFESRDGLCFLLQLHLPISYSIWRPKNSDIALVFV